MKRISTNTWIVFLTLAAFLIWKLTMLHFRFGDENVYFYMTKAIKDGLLPYRDFNLADPPVFIYLFTAFSSLIGKHFLLFKMWPPLFDAANAFLIFCILRKIGNRFAALGPLLYLFSFTVLSTSDYVTGAETAIFFMLLAIYLDLLKKPFLSGISWALGCLSKLYIAPALLAYLGYKLMQKKGPSVVRTIVAGALAGLAVLLPFFLLARHQTIANLIVYQLHRPAGLNKWNVLSLFLEMEWFLALAGIAGAFATKHKEFIWPLLASFLFLLWFRDLYYLYLHLLLPFLAILAAEFVEILSEKHADLAWAFLGLYALILIYPLVSYTTTYAPQGVFEHPEEVAAALPRDKPAYGVQEAAPLVALIADRPLFQHVIDTNTQNFETGALNKKDISDDIMKSGAYLVARIANYPDRGVTDVGYEAYFTETAFSTCKKVALFNRPSPSDVLNAIAIYRCPSGS